MTIELPPINYIQILMATCTGCNRSRCLMLLIVIVIICFTTIGCTDIPSIVFSNFMLVGKRIIGAAVYIIPISDNLATRSLHCWASAIITPNRTRHNFRLFHFMRMSGNYEHCAHQCNDKQNSNSFLHLYLSLL